MTTATAKQVREHYKAQGYQVRIDDDGHVFYRKIGKEWQEGRWVVEYLVDERGNVHLT